jgi:hypothetical protein
MQRADRDCGQWLAESPIGSNSDVATFLDDIRFTQRPDIAAPLRHIRQVP